MGLVEIQQWTSIFDYNRLKQSTKIHGSGAFSYHPLGFSHLKCEKGSTVHCIQASWLCMYFTHAADCHECRLKQLLGTYCQFFRMLETISCTFTILWDCRSSSAKREAIQAFWLCMHFPQAACHADLLPTYCQFFMMFETIIAKSLDRDVLLGLVIDIEVLHDVWRAIEGSQIRCCGSDATLEPWANLAI